MRRALAIDLGGTELKAGMVRETGAVDGYRACPTDRYGGPKAVMTQMANLLMQVLRDTEGEAPVGLGIAAPGPLDCDRGIALSPPSLEGWRDVPLAAEMRARVGLPVRIENNANAAALGEWRFGGGHGVDNLVYVTVSTGIGGGIIADGHLLRGRRGLAAEIGHMTIDAGAGETLFGGPPGTWEALASGTAFGLEATYRAGGYDGARLRRAAGSGTITARHVVEEARGGDPLACDLLDEEARLLGIGFVNLLHLYAPERIIVGGGVSAGLDLMQGRIERTIRDRALPPYADVPVSATVLGQKAGLVGAASLVL